MFNALKYTKSLEEAGFTREQAEATMSNTLEMIHQNLATKKDMKNLQSEFKQDIIEVRSETDQKIQEFRFEMRGEFQKVYHRMDLLEKSLIFKLTTTMVTLFGVAIGALKAL